MQSSSTPRALPWDHFDAFHALGLKPAAATRPADPLGVTPLDGVAGPSPMDRLMPLWHPDNPMFWFAGLLAVTVGLVAASTQLRIGPVRASLAAGKTS